MIAEQLCRDYKGTVLLVIMALCMTQQPLPLLQRLSRSPESILPY